MSEVEIPVARSVETGTLRWLQRSAVALLVVDVVALAMAAQANFTLGGSNPPWVGHRWHPIVVGAAIGLALSAVALFASSRRRAWTRTTLALLLSATLVLDGASIMWHDRAFGTRADIEAAFAQLHLDGSAVPTGETYVAGPGGFQTPDDPSGTRTWQVSGPVRSTCDSAANAAERWSTDGMLRAFNDAPKPGGFGCHFEVTYRAFEVTFQDVAEASGHSWTLKAFLSSSSYETG